jgi:prevent-host-death family protein
MGTVSLQDLQQNPAEILDRVKAGEHLVVVRDGRPAAELRPVVAIRPAPRPYGLAAGAFKVPDDFDAPLPDDLVREFEGR